MLELQWVTFRSGKWKPDVRVDLQTGARNNATSQDDDSADKKVHQHTRDSLEVTDQLQCSRDGCRRDAKM